MDYLKEKKTNILYNFFSFSKTESLPKISLSNKKIYLLGKNFSIKKNTNKDIENFLKNIPWFSYRKNFDPILIEKNILINLNTDNGWGCMIRVGQTMLFIVLKKYFKNKKSDFFILQKYFKEKKKQEKISDEKKQENISDEKKQENISDGKKVKNKQKNNYDLFSIQNFVIIANKLYSKKPGNWFRSTTFLLSLEHLLKNNFKNLRVVNFVENIITGKKLLQNIYNKKIDITKFKNFSEIKNYIINNKWDNEIVLSLSTMLGLKKIEKKYKLFMDKFLETKSNIGILGGYKSSAYYIIGKNNNNGYYYLDPHYVKDSKNFEDFKEENILNDYLDKFFFEIEYEKLNKSLSFIFYFKGPQDFLSFFESLEILKKLFGEEFFFSMMVDDFEDDMDLNEITSF